MGLTIAGMGHPLVVRWVTLYTVLLSRAIGSNSLQILKYDAVTKLVQMQFSKTSIQPGVDVDYGVSMFWIGSSFANRTVQLEETPLGDSVHRGHLLTG